VKKGLRCGSHLLTRFGVLLHILVVGLLLNFKEQTK
jgi:hypothetical protein